MGNKYERTVYVLLLFGLCLISFGLGFYVFKLSEQKEVRQIPVNDSIVLNAIPLLGQDVTVKRSFVGYAEAINQVQIVPFINGYIQRVPAQAGKFVNKNDMLVVIEPDEYKAKVDAAEATLMQAQAAFSYNKNYYERVQKAGKRAFSETETDNAENNFLQAQAALKNAEANLALAKVNYGHTLIKAPISGLTGNFTLSSGDYVSPTGGSLFNIVQTNPIRVVFSLTDTEYLDMIQQGLPLFKDSVIKLKLADGRIFKYAGEFKYTDNQLNKNTNSLAVYTYFKNDENELLPNSFVTVEVETTFKNTVLADKNLIKMEADGNFILLAHNQNIQKQPVQIITEKGNQFVLKNTFQTGDLILTEDVPAIPAGAQIKFNINR